MNECKTPGCERPVHVKKRGLCRSCYYRWSLLNKPRVGKTPCAVEDCSRTVYARGHCKSHYGLLMRNGTPELQQNLRRSCEDCSRPVAFRKTYCKSCYMRRWLDQHAGTRSVADFDEDPKSYENAHLRLVLIRGKASSHKCAECRGPAEEWALSATATNLRFGGISRRHTLSAYSVNPYDYLPMCKKDHRAYDARFGNRNNKTGKHAQTPTRWEPPC